MFSGARSENIGEPGLTVAKVYEMSARRRKSKISREEVFKLRKQGLSLRKIAKQLGCSHPRVHEILSQGGRSNQT